MYITKTIMKFKLLDNKEVSTTERYNETDQQHKSHYSDSYQYLDELLDKTFILDYFMERRRPNK
ncbi:MAG: hypothetical protein EBU66_14415 [Bacteroidetes bacterium]|jgi:hypothetical protein|nr:hypothetical protein [Bacteroidota bacterium]